MDTTNTPAGVTAAQNAIDAAIIEATRQALEEVVSLEFLLQFFRFAHLPPHLVEVSAPYAELAVRTFLTLPKNPERTVALRKLLEAKDCAVRAKLAG